MRRCIVPTCNNSSSSWPPNIVFLKLPSKQTLQEAWLKVLGMTEWKPVKGDAICSYHFRVEDLNVDCNGQWTVTRDAIPTHNLPNLSKKSVCDLKVCRICFATDCKLYSMPMYKHLDQAYELLTGLTLSEEDHMPLYLCVECTHRLQSFARFRSRSLQAHQLLLEVFQKHDQVTLETIKSINEKGDFMESKLCIKHNAMNQYNLKMEHKYAKEDDNMKEDEQADLEEFLKTHTDFVDNIKVEKDLHETPIDESVLSTLQDSVDVVVKMEEISVEETFGKQLYNDNGTESDDINCFIGEEESLAHEKENSTLFDKIFKKKINVPKVHYSELIVYDELSCDKCSYKTKSDKRFLKHLDKHKTKVISDTFFEGKHRRQVESHGRKEQSERERERPYLCNICDRSFKVKCNLIRHLRLHSGENPYTCDVCNKKFHRIDNYKHHLKTHPNVTTVKKSIFVCDICKKPFGRKCNLKSHLKLHSGERPYKCKICNKTFNRNGNLKTHLKMHTGEKPFSCDECKISFSLKCNLRSHKKLVH